MFKTFSGTAPASPSTTSLTGNVPTVGWVFINDGAADLVVKISGYTSDPFKIAPGEMMKIPIPINIATVEGTGGTTAYRAISFGLASLYQEYSRELPAKLSIQGGGSAIVDSTMLANSVGGSNVDTTAVVNAPTVGVHLVLGANQTKFWQADRKYAVTMMVGLKTTSTGTSTDYADLLKSPSPGGSYTSLTGGPFTLDNLVPLQLTPVAGLATYSFDPGECLKVQTTGTNSHFNVMLILTPIA